MSQRNFNNDRYKGDGPKGKTRKSAGSAKPAKAAATSVYVSQPSAKEKRKMQEEKEQKKAERAARAQNDAAAVAKFQTMVDDYGKWRRIWIILVVVAVVFAIGSWAVSYLTASAGDEAGWRNTLMVVCLVAAYAAIIAAIFIDMKHIRPLRKVQNAAYKQQKASRKAQKHAEEEAAAKAASGKRHFWQRKKD